MAYFWRVVRKVNILNIKQFCQEWKNELRAEAARHQKSKRLGIIGHAEMPYVKGIMRDCEEVGIAAKVYDYDEDILFMDYVKIIYTAEQVCDYIILQTPLPPSIDKEEIKRYIDSRKDIDNLTGLSKAKHCTPLGIIKYLDKCEFEYEGADVVVVGRSDVVGKPMAQMLLDKDCTVTICHSKTEYLTHYTEQADLVIVAVGKPEWFDPELAKNAKMIIDVGINLVDGRVIGDIQHSSEAKNVTPVPGGVGLLTRCALLEQIINN